MLFTRRKYFLLSLLVSVIGHFLFLNWAPHLPSTDKTHKKEKQSSINVKIRKVGVKKETKLSNTFYTKTKIKKAKKKPQKKQSSLDLKSLSIKDKIEKKMPPSLPQNKDIYKPSKSSLTINDVPIQVDSSKHELKSIKSGVLKELLSSPLIAPILEQAGFDFFIEPSSGIKEDELNSIEKMYYGFQRRMFYTYVKGYVKSYQKAILKYPRLKQLIRSKKHLLRGRVIFDENGHIVSIKILESSVHDEVHELFEEALKEMKRLPNPPRDMLNQNGQFSVYYTLQINE